MKENTYYLFDNGKKIAYSKYFEKVLNKTVNTKDGMIYCNNVLVWVQNPQWQHIEFASGSNPYICVTEKEFKRILRKYKNNIEQIKVGYWFVNDKK